MKTKSKYLSLCIFVFIHLTLYSQQKTWEWVKAFGGNNWDITGGAAIDSKNNIYVAGTFRDTLYCGNKKLLSKGSEDIFLARFDEKGNLKDTWSIGGEKTDQATCLAASADGTLYLGGSLTDIATFDKTEQNGKGSRLFLTGLNTKGQFTWVKQYTYTGAASLYLLGAMPDGTIYGAGTFSDTLKIEDKTLISEGKNDVFIVKLNSNGNILKVITFGSEGDEFPGSVSVSTKGEVTITGSFEKPFGVGEINFAPRPHHKANTFIIHLNKDLDTSWGKHISGEEYCHLSAIQTDARGNLYTVGSFNMKLSLQDTTLQSSGLVDAFVAKFSAEGTLCWAKNIGTDYYDYANHLNIDNLEGIMITGSIGDTLHVDSLSVSPTTEGNTAFAVQLSPEGKAIWGDCISGGGRDFCDNALLDKDGNLYLYGSFRNFFEKEKEKIASRGDQDIFLAKYYNCQGGKGEIQGARTICPGAWTELKVKSGFKNVIWNDSVKGNHLYISKAGMYTVKMLDKKGCRYHDTATIALSPLPVFSLGEDTTLFTGDTLILQAPKEYATYKWDDYFYTPQYIVTAAENKPGKTVCWLMIKDSTGCTFTDTLRATFVQRPEWIQLDKLKVTVYPNPVIRELYWSIDTDKPSKLFLELTDNNGKVYMSQYVAAYFPGQVMRLNMEGKGSGQYLLRIKNATAYKSIPVIKQ